MNAINFIPAWLKNYRREWWTGDLTAGLIVCVMLIPQSLAYAMLAGLPPQMGLYASILPIVVYAWLGSSMSLAVGPVAVVSLMTATAISPLATTGSAEYISLAIMLALLSGIMLLVFGWLKLGALAHLLSHPVIAGFITGSGLLIWIGQIKPLLGLKFKADSTFQTLVALGQHISELNGITTGLGVGSLVFLWFARSHLTRVLQGVGLSGHVSGLLAKLAPMLCVVGSTALVMYMDWHHTAGVAVVGSIPAGLPTWHTPVWDMASIKGLWIPALLISLVGFVESISVGTSLAQKKKQHIVPNKELLGLGAANVVSALSGGYPVTGGFARSVVNFAAGAHTPLSGLISAVLMALVLVTITPWFEALPLTVLAATIIMAVSQLIDFSTLKTTWHFERADAVAFLATVVGVLVLGVEEGIVLGVILSLLSLVWRTSNPHMAMVGRVGQTEHFRNIERHKVTTQPHQLLIRIDEALYFGNSHAVSEQLQQWIKQYPETRYLILILSAVNRIDSTALEMLTELQQTLLEQGITLALAEVKGPVMDKLQITKLGHRLKGLIFLSTHEAVVQLH